MARGPLSKETKQKRALDLASEMLKMFGKTPEAIEEAVQLPLESQDDLMREAQSVLNYFEARGDGFKQIICKQCGELFAYSWNVDGVKYCSIPCMDKALKAIGLKWTPGRDVRERWGSYVPAVVPPRALQAMQESFDAQEDQHPETQDEHKP